MPLIEKHVQCCGNFRRSFDSFGDKVVLHINTALDCDQPIDQLKTVFYEPEEVEVSGLLHKAVYPGPPEYMSVEMGDHPEEVVILTLKNPINIEVKGEKIILMNRKKGVRELQVVFSDSMTFKTQHERRSHIERNSLSCTHSSSPQKSTHDGEELEC